MCQSVRSIEQPFYLVKKASSMPNVWDMGVFLPLAKVLIQCLDHDCIPSQGVKGWVSLGRQSVEVLRF